MITTTSILTEQLRSFADPAGKIMRMTKSGELFPLTRGIYETDGSVSGELLASAIYGPSYLSFDYALSYYGLTPEAVYTFTCATFGKKKKKIYENKFGRYSYRDVPSAVYPLGVRVMENGGYTVQMASPEKALCDKLWTLAPVHSMKELSALLFDDLRIDEVEFSKLNKEDLTEICETYGSNTMKYLKKLIGRVL